MCPAAPIPPNEGARLQALYRYELLDTLCEDAFDELTRLASLICETPIALVSLVDSDRQWFKSKVGLDAEQTPREQAFCAYSILDDPVFEVPDALQDPRFVDNPLVVGEPHIRFYAGAPLVANDGYRLGTLCVIDRRPRSLSPQQSEALRALSRQAMSLIELRSALAEVNHQSRLIERTRELYEQTLQRQLEDKERSQRRSFLGRVSHEFRTPLNAVIGMTSLLKKTAKTPTQARQLGLIARASEHMLELISNTLELSRADGGDGAGEVAKFGLHTLVADIIELMRTRALARNNRLTVDLGNSESEFSSNARHVRQILLNLLSNAIKFTSNGEVVVTLRQDHNGLVIAVRDTGIGMQPEQLERAFDEYTRFAHGDGQPGSGLGLAITQALCRRLSGNIVLSSTFGTGTTATVTLPALT